MQEMFEKIRVMLAEQYRKNRHESHNDEWNVGIDQAEQIVNEVAAEYNNGWIPVSERMPEEPKPNPLFENKPLDFYMVTERDATYSFRAFWNGERFTDGWSKLDVIAWQPLPQPYKPKEDKNANKNSKQKSNSKS